MINVNYENLKYFWDDESVGYTVLVCMLLIVVVISVIVSVWSLWLYMAMSWTKKPSSRDVTGLENSRDILDLHGDQDIEVKKNFWSLTYVNYNFNTRVLKIGPIDSVRKSLWTIAITGRQAYSAHLLSEHKKGNKIPISTIWIRLQTYWFQVFLSWGFNLGIFIFAGLWVWDATLTNNFLNIWLLFFLAVAITLPMLLATASIKTSKFMMKNVDHIFGDLITEDEKDKIKKLWKIEYINSIVEMLKLILMLIIYILRIIDYFTSND